VIFGKLVHFQLEYLMLLPLVLVHSSFYIFYLMIEIKIGTWWGTSWPFLCMTIFSRCTR